MIVMRFSLRERLVAGQVFSPPVLLFADSLKTLTQPTPQRAYLSRGPAAQMDGVTLLEAITLGPYSRAAREYTDASLGKDRGFFPGFTGYAKPHKRRRVDEQQKFHKTFTVRKP